MNVKYKRMIEGIQRQENGRKRRKKSEEWFLYMLECGDGSFYTGITNDVARRFKMHQEGRGSRYTKTHRPVKLLYQEKCANRSRALVREYAVKTFPRKKKEELIRLSS